MFDDENALLKLYNEERPIFERLSGMINPLLSEHLKRSNIKFSSIKSRVKEKDSFIQKAKEKSYADPASECTDFLGIRIIVYLESDIDRVKEKVQDLFEIDLQRSVDKRDIFAVREFGYRSMHMICMVGQNRLALPEYRDFTGKSFEIQIRTALQDTWAELEHAYNYKAKCRIPEGSKAVS